MKNWVIFITILVLTACSEENIRMVYTETQCADPWVNINANSTEDKVIEYLDDLGIKVFKVEIERYHDGAVCTACTCVSGNNIYVVVSEKDREELEALGFRSS